MINVWIIAFASNHCDNQDYIAECIEPLPQESMDEFSSSKLLASILRKNNYIIISQ